MGFVSDILFRASLRRANLETEPQMNHRYFAWSHDFTINKRAVYFIQHFADEPLLNNEAVN
jgi:hypothetical protein